MPIDFRAWARVYAFFRRWREHGRVKEFHDRLRGRVRIAEGRRAEPTAGIIDAQSVKAAASVPSASCGYDGGKKINGSKRHVIVDSLDLLLMLWVTPADGTDRGAARSMLPQLAARARTHAQLARSWSERRQALSRTRSSQAPRCRVSRSAQAPDVSGGPASGRTYCGTGVESLPSSSGSIRSAPRADRRQALTVTHSSRSAGGSPRLFSAG